MSMCRVNIIFSPMFASFMFAGILNQSLDELCWKRTLHEESEQTVITFGLKCFTAKIKILIPFLTAIYFLCDG